MGTTDGTVELHLEEELILCDMDFSFRHELVDGQTIAEVPTPQVLKDGSSSTDLTVTGVVLDATLKIVQYRITVESSAVEGDHYEIKMPITLSDGAKITECQDVVITPC